MANAIMIQGTASNAGKSLLAAGLCRIFAQDGYKAAPFKSQNMALNSAITPDGFEMGRAQVVQAEAAGVAPDVRMNPILLKPTSHVGSQVIVNGVPRGTMAAGEYFRYRKSLIPEVMAAYESLAAEYDIIVIEGAGSPAEINLRQDDIVNRGRARRAHAPVLLCGDIDRGGVFASLYGTAALLEAEERACMQTLAHEVLHTCPGCRNHGALWKEYAARMNGAYGYAISRTGTCEALGVGDVRPVRPRLLCNRCGRVFCRGRRSPLVDHPERYRCRCGGVLRRSN